MGDVMFDAAIHFGARVANRKPPADNLPSEYALATVHRASNTDHRETLSVILDGFAKCPLPIILPLHPRTKARLDGFDLVVPPTVRVLPPVGFLDMIWLERHASVILTDSGGVQKEAYFHGTPCVTLREETEWSELVDAGGIGSVRLGAAMQFGRPLLKVFRPCRNQLRSMAMEQLQGGLRRS